MEKSNVTYTRNLGLCVSCEICAAVCPEGAITMEYENGQFLPKIDDGKCTECGLCLEVCPGIDVDPLGLRYRTISNDMFDGPYLESYTAYSNDSEIRKTSASGGLITNLVVELIRNEQFDAAFVLDFDKFAGKPARLKATNNADEIVNAAKSKYVPASIYEVIKTLKECDGRRYIIVGTPCQIYGTKKFMKRCHISEEGLLFLGLFCDKTLNFNAIRYFEDTYGKPGKKLIKFEFRTKEKHGWPGNSKLCFDSGRELIVDRAVRMQLKRFFQLNRCLFCLDKLNVMADISFGDCYIEGKSDFNGKSSVIVRTEKGRKIFNKYSYLFSLEKENVEEIRFSQHLIDRKDNLQYAKVLIKENNLYPDITPDYEIDSQIARGLSKAQKYIEWGQKYNVNKIRFALFLSKVMTKSGAIYRYLGKGLIVAVVAVEGLFIHIYGKRKHVLRKTKGENIIIIGGNLFNKGAQAMTFTVVDQMKRRFPDKNVCLFSTQDFERGDKGKSIYRFNILPCDLRTKMRLLGFRNSLFIKNTNYVHLEDELKKVITDADFFIDISGYGLSSQWGTFSSVDYLLNVIIAQKYLVPYYIFPQSIGPFNYPIKHKIFLYLLMKLYLKYPEKIFVREKEGLRCVREFSKKNVEKSYDIVLQNEELNLSNIYVGDIHFEDIKIEPNAVGIIPNLRVIERANPDEIYPAYSLLINRLIAAQKTVYILRHSHEDLEICKKIKVVFPSTESVKLISDDLNAIQLENIIKQFDFVVASRYHSIVHAYKNGVPALVIGWATKYSELLDGFGQLDYFFDCRSNINIDKVGNKLNKMMQDYKQEGERIINKMNILVNKENPFDMLFAPKR
jgi:coenzyme F420-reducing hydrogenase beta subunit/polysaccharide pyruvyl transferase WcaK-like protein